MSVPVSKQPCNSSPAAAKKKQRFHQATPEEKDAVVAPPKVTPDQKLMQ